MTYGISEVIDIADRITIDLERRLDYLFRIEVGEASLILYAKYNGSEPNRVREYDPIFKATRFFNYFHQEWCDGDKEHRDFSEAKQILRMAGLVDDDGSLTFDQAIAYLFSAPEDEVNDFIRYVSVKNGNIDWWTDEHVLRFMLDNTIPLGVNYEFERETE